MRRDDNWIIARLEDEKTYEEAENRDEDTRKESRPESRQPFRKGVWTFKLSSV